MNVDHRSIEEIESAWKDFERPKVGDVFRHYKGGTYTIVETGFLENTEEICVIYKSQRDGHVCVRTAMDFFSEVEVGGRKMARFTKT